MMEACDATEDDIDIVKNEITPSDDDLQISVLIEKARKSEGKKMFLVTFTLV